MSKLRSLLGKKMWLGVFFVFLISLTVDALCSLLLVKGIIPDTSVNTCVYIAWGIGGLIGSCIAANGENGTLLRGCLLSILVFGLTWLLGFLIFGSLNFGGFAAGVAVALFVGCILGSFFGGGKKRKKSHAAGKRVNRNRHKK